MVNIFVKELVGGEFQSKELNVAQVNTEDGRTFSLSVSLKFLESSKQIGTPEVTTFSDSPVECDTSGCLNSSPESERSGVLNASEFADNAVCNVDDFLNDFNDATFQLDSPSSPSPIATLSEPIIDEADCESIADSDCNSRDDEYFVVDELVGKRFNEKTQKYEFLLRPKRYLPKNDILWNPIDNMDNFDISLLEHGRLYIEIPDSLKREERRKRSILQDKFLSEVNLPSGKKNDYLSSVAEGRSSSACRKLDSLMGMDNSLKFDKMWGSTENTMDVDMGAISSNFDELVPVVADSLMFPLLEEKPKKTRKRAEKPVYHCDHCEFETTMKRTFTQHIRQHIPQPTKTNNVRRRGPTQGMNGFTKCAKRVSPNKTKVTKESKADKIRSTKSKLANGIVENVKKEAEEIDSVDEDSAKNTLQVISDQNDVLELPENEVNQIDEASTEACDPSDIKSATNRVRARVRKVRKKNTLEPEQPKCDQSFNSKLARKRLCSKIGGAEPEKTLRGPESKKSKKKLFPDDAVVTPSTKILDELPSGGERNDIEQKSESYAVELTSEVSICIKRERSEVKQSTPLPILVSIPLSVLESSVIERLRKNSKSTVQTSSTEGTSPRVQPSDEEVIRGVLNRIINVLDPISDEEPNDSSAENKSKELIGKFDKTASAVVKSEPESQVLSTSGGVTSVSKLAKKSEPQFQCRFCKFIAVGNVKYRKHVIKNHVDKFTQCVFCTKSFMSETSMEQHRLEKHGNYLPFIAISRCTLSNSSADTTS